MIQGRTLGYRVVNVLILAVLALLALICLAPFLHTVSVSVSNRLAVGAQQVGLWPVGLQVDNYRFIVASDRQFLGSLAISVYRVLAGVTIQLLVIVLTAYPLSLDSVTMPGRRIYKMVLIFGMLFSGGLIPYYLALRDLRLLNKLLVLVIPNALNIFYTLVITNFFRNIPKELREAGMIDGASHVDVLFRIYLPISLPSLATVALFSAVAHWNSWFDGIVFLNSRTQWPLQSYLYSAVLAQTRLTWQSIENVSLFQNATPEGMSAAMIVLTTLPILLVYPALQRYFVAGLTIGSVKG
jgi:putative aldouronate transport system permease protein